MRNTPLKWQALLLFLEEYFVTVTYGMDRASGRLESMETETDETDWIGHEPWLPLWESISGQDSRTWLCTNELASGWSKWRHLQDVLRRHVCFKRAGRKEEHDGFAADLRVWSWRWRVTQGLRTNAHRRANCDVYYIPDISYEIAKNSVCCFPIRLIVPVEQSAAAIYFYIFITKVTCLCACASVFFAWLHAWMRVYVCFCLVAGKSY